MYKRQVQRDLIVARHADPDFKLEQLRDERLGTVLGFSYPNLEPLLAGGATVSYTHLDVYKRQA